MNKVKKIVNVGLRFVVVTSMSGRECPMAMLRTDGQSPRRSNSVPDGEAEW